ncbi:hypothetical protein LUZ60_007677 [Juncus effusus]|nr:hypothetical protein LUZ60_007677 [Juncus effusus]
MPSKGKKKPKSPPSSPGTPSTPRTPNLQTPNPHRGKIAASPLSNSISNKHVDIKFFSVAASEYPSLIPNVDSAFYGNITGSDFHKEGNKAFVYLSESAFTDFSAKPGSLVSVWLVPLEDQLEGDDRKVNNAGDYFAVATIFPSSKMLKDGVRLSWDLSCTLDFPSKGRSIFIYPLSSNFCIKKCDKLNLSLISSKTEGDNELSDDSAAWLAIEDERIKASLQEYALRWLNGRHLLKGNIVGIPISGKTCLFKVEDDDSGGFYALSVDGSTKVEIVSDNNGLLDSGNEGPDKDGLQVENDEVAEGDWPTLGGLSKEFTDLKEIILFSLAKHQSFPRYKGVLLYGPPGTGKTSLACLCAKNAGAQLFTINGPEIVSQYYGESEQTLHHIFDSAKKSAPSVVFIDELDAIAPARKDGNEELSLRMVATLLKLMDEIHRNDRVLLIAATNRPDSLDPALRRPGRLDREIEIGVPSPKQRLDILVTLMSKMDHSFSASQLNSLASETHGFVGADLAALCNEAALNALRRHINSKGERESSFNVSVMNSLSESLSKLAVSENVKGEDEDPDLVVRFDDFERAKLKIRPSAMREVMLELPKVRWEDVGGQSKLKTQLIEAVQWPQTNPEALTRLGIRAPRGLLMTGPPGCSKTLMARAVASEAKLNFLAVKGPELLSKWVGESEKAVKKLFEKARVNSPAIIFFDEIDGLAGTRGEGDGVCVGERVLTQLLVEMDGLDSGAGVTVVAATNRPDKIDPALLRPGRFDRLLDVQPPDEMDREDIFRIHTRNIPCGTDVKLKELAILTHGYTGADIKLVCREAAISALEEDIDVREVSMRHFEGAVGKVHPSDLKFYQDLATQFRRLVDSTSITA